MHSGAERDVYEIDEYELDLMYAEFDTRPLDWLQKARRRCASWLLRKNVNFYNSVMLFTCGWTMTGLYITGTYLVLLPTWLSSLQLALGIVFVVEFLLRLFVSDSPIRFALNFRSFCEVMAFTSAIFAGREHSQNFSYLASYAAFRQFLDIEKRLLGNVDPKPMLLIRIGMHTFVAVMILSSTITLIETLGPLNSDASVPNDSPFFLFTGIRLRDDWSWFNSFYFMVVTLTTVGYGDFFPVTELGRAFVVVAIIMGGFILGSILRELPDVVSGGVDIGTYRKTPHRDHLVVYGECLDLAMVKEFVVEFYSDWRNESFDLLFVSDTPQWTLQEWSSFVVLDPRYERFTCYLKGSLANEDEFDRAYGSLALAFFVFSSSVGVSPTQSDANAVLVVSAIRARAPDAPLYSIMQRRETVRQAKYVSSRRLGASGKVDSSRRLQRYFHASANTMEQLSREEGNDTFELRRVGNDVLSLTEFQTALMAESLRTNGLSALISDLLLYTNRAIHCDLDTFPWAREYSMGSAVYITSKKLPDVWKDKTVADVALPLFEAGIVPLGFRTDSLCLISAASPDVRLEPNQTCLLMTFLSDEVLDKVLESLAELAIESIQTYRFLPDDHVTERQNAEEHAEHKCDLDDEKRDPSRLHSSAVDFKFSEADLGESYDDDDGDDDGVRTPVVVLWTKSTIANSHLPPKYFSVSGLWWTHGHDHSHRSWNDVGLPNAAAVVVFSNSAHDSSSDSQTLITLLTLEMFSSGNPQVFFCVEIQEDKSLHLMNPKGRTRRRGLQLGVSPCGQRILEIAQGSQSVATALSNSSSAAESGLRNTVNGKLGSIQSVRNISSLMRLTSLEPGSLGLVGSSWSMSAEASFASGEFVVRWTSYILLLRAMHEPGLTDFVLGLLGIRGSELGTSTDVSRSFGQSSFDRKARAGWGNCSSILLTPVPEAWLAKTNPDERTFRSLYAFVVTELRWIPLGLYRSGESPICYPRFDRSQRNPFAGLKGGWGRRHGAGREDNREMGIIRLGSTEPTEQWRAVSPKPSFTHTTTRHTYALPTLGTEISYSQISASSRELAYLRGQTTLSPSSGRLRGTFSGNSRKDHPHAARPAWAPAGGLFPPKTTTAAAAAAANNELPYVYTLPEPYALVHENDAVFAFNCRCDH
ncbi:Potassium channel subfamily T member 2 [Porphyridium purpureum]|uniref:Potassium channel subfamily T member 2 n=1 Tax=Porphyridium purpureum TaxID=35688 RepID=A0A5J4Z352_PORPP|nr:Potassium channel subfamily T member 2 [Porphyridium purpureum]|eukprot:POR8484..scf295_1